MIKYRNSRRDVFSKILSKTKFQNLLVLWKLPIKGVHSFSKVARKKPEFSQKWTPLPVIYHDFDHKCSAPTM